MNFAQKKVADAIAELDAALLKPNPASEDDLGVAEYFDPWADLFPCLYGSYAPDFDRLAICTLTDILDGEVRRQDLAAWMFREMLCTKGLCTYGTSPRVCFAEPEFYDRLPTLIERWKQYSAVSWSAEQ